MIKNTHANLIAELRAIEGRTRRIAERESALKANAKDYKIDPESMAALERGDRQRETGVYESPISDYFDGTIDTSGWESEGGN